MVLRIYDTQVTTTCRMSKYYRGCFRWGFFAAGRLLKLKFAIYHRASEVDPSLHTAGYLSLTWTIGTIDSGNSYTRGIYH